MVEPPPSNLLGRPSHHACSPDTASSSGDAEPESVQQEPIPPTKSPQSQHVVKQARFTSPGPETHVNASFLAPSASPLPSSTHQPPTMRSPAEDHPPHCHCLPHHATYVQTNWSTWNHSSIPCLPWSQSSRPPPHSQLYLAHIC